MHPEGREAWRTSRSRKQGQCTCLRQMEVGGAVEPGWEPSAKALCSVPRATAAAGVCNFSSFFLLRCRWLEWDIMGAVTVGGVTLGGSHGRGVMRGRGYCGRRSPSPKVTGGGEVALGKAAVCLSMARPVPLYGLLPSARSFLHSHVPRRCVVPM